MTDSPYKPPDVENADGVLKAEAGPDNQFQGNTERFGGVAFAAVVAGMLCLLEYSINIAHDNTSFVLAAVCFTAAAVVSFWTRRHSG